MLGIIMDIRDRGGNQQMLGEKSSLYLYFVLARQESAFARALCLRREIM